MRGAAYRRGRPASFRPPIPRAVVLSHRFADAPAGLARPSAPPSPGGAEFGPAIARARDALLALQEEDGHWCAELEGDSIL